MSARSHPSNGPWEDLDAWVDEVFSYHAPTDLQVKAYGNLRAAAATMARALLVYCPPCADRSAALRKLREVVMLANASIALDPGGR